MELADTEDITLSEQARSLLKFLFVVTEWANADDPRAKPYFDADAVRWTENEGERHLAFHPQRFDAVMKAQGS